MLQNEGNIIMAAMANSNVVLYLHNQGSFQNDRVDISFPVSGRDDGHYLGSDACGARASGTVVPH